MKVFKRVVDVMTSWKFMLVFTATLVLAKVVLAILPRAEFYLGGLRIVTK